MQLTLFIATGIVVILTAMYIGFKAGVNSIPERSKSLTFILTIAAEKAGADLSVFADEASRMIDEEMGK
jgi:hypothetical protein